MQEAERCRARAEALRDRHPFAVEVLTLYLALLDVWEQVPAAPAEGVAGWAAEHVLPQVVRTTVAHGPEPLAKALTDVTVDPERPSRRVSGVAGEERGGREANEKASATIGTEMLTAWLSGAELDPVERYLARATLRGVAYPAGKGERRCPACGGPPQLSFRTESGDRLVSGRRKLQCAHCMESWDFSSSTCPSCGETSGSKRSIYFEHAEGPKVGRGEDAAATFPHLRVEGCESCRRYLIDVDLGRDPRAVPEVDELAALPLDLYAAERGLSKITPNLMGF